MAIVHGIGAQAIEDDDYDMLGFAFPNAAQRNAWKSEEQRKKADRHRLKFALAAGQFEQAFRYDRVTRGPGSVLPCRPMSDSTEKALRFRFPVARRLKRSRDFERVRLEGRMVRGGMLMLGVMRVEEEPAFHVGLVTSRRIGGAVVRNRIRRRLREIVRRHQHALPGGYWLVVVARPAAAQADSATLEAEWLRLAKRAGILQNSCSCS